MTLFRHRIEAGGLLAERLKSLKIFNPLVIALPRGGVPVAYPVALRLNSPLDVLVTRKIGSPDHPEFGIGAISEDGTIGYDESAVRRLNLSEMELKILARKEQLEARRRVERYRQGRPMISVEGKTVILVDDGLATGITARIAIRSLRAQKAQKIILAVPVGAADTVEALAKIADQVICLQQPPFFTSVGSWYEDFSQTSDEEVIEILRQAFRRGSRSEDVVISDGVIHLPGNLSLPHAPQGLVIFAHGSGSTRNSPRNLQVAQTLHDAGLGTLLFDLLEPDESLDRDHVFDIPLLASRLILAYSLVRQMPTTSTLPIGFFGASTGGGAALWAAASLKEGISAIVSRGGRPDLALERLSQVTAPTLLIVGGNDEPVIDLNRKAHQHLLHSKILIVAGATHLFEEAGKLEVVARHAATWFEHHFDIVTKRTSQRAPAA